MGQETCKFRSSSGRKIKKGIAMIRFLLALRNGDLFHLQQSILTFTGNIKLDMDMAFW
jgi:hypothetical protein